MIAIPVRLGTGGMRFKADYCEIETHKEGGWTWLKGRCPHCRIAELKTENQRLRDELTCYAEALPNNLYANSKDWTHSEPLERIEWLKSMYESKKEEANMWCEQLAQSVDEVAELNALLNEKNPLHGIDIRTMQTEIDKYKKALEKIMDGGDA